MFRFVKILKAEHSDYQCSGNIVLTAAEITEARITWIRNCQIELEQQPNYETLQQQLGVYADTEHIQGCKGRVDRASLPDETRHPVLLPRNHHLSTLVVKSCHKKIHHGGTKERLAELGVFIGSRKEDNSCERFYMIEGSFLKRNLKDSGTFSVSVGSDDNKTAVD